MAAGIAPLEAKAAQQKEAVDEADRGLAEARSALVELDRTHDASVLEGDATYREAVALLAAADEREDLNQLYQEALRTPTPQDEEIVRRIQATDVMINRSLRKAVVAPDGGSYGWLSACEPLKRLGADAPMLRHGLIALAVTMAIGFALNDSGILIPAIGIALVVPLLASVSANWLIHLRPSAVTSASAGLTPVSGG